MGQPIRRTQADRHVHASPVLSVCRDTCDGSKHAVFEAKRVETDTRIDVVGSYELPDDRTGEMKKYEVKWPHVYVRVHGEFVQDLEFADRCIEAWDSLLDAEGLKPGDALRFRIG